MKQVAARRGGQYPPEIKWLECPTGDCWGIEFIAEIPQVTNRFQHTNP